VVSIYASRKKTKHEGGMDVYSDNETTILVGRALFCTNKKENRSSGEAEQLVTLR
jgi:hypothetical protein